MRKTPIEGQMDTFLMLQAVREESNALAESKTVEEVRFEEERAMAKSESRQNCGRKASPSNLSSASSSTKNGNVIGLIIGGHACSTRC